MRVKFILLVLMTACISACASPDAARNPAPEPGQTDEVTSILMQTLPDVDQTQGERISRISATFLGTPYEADTLIGSPTRPEALVINFNGVDCYTLLDYVQALSRSHDRASFEANLIRTRYAGGEVSYRNRRHFFSDWFADSPRNADDMTRTLSPDTVTVVKHLNRQASGAEQVPGLGVIARPVTYIPARAITPQVLNQIQTGDYVGFTPPVRAWMLRMWGLLSGMMAAYGSGTPLRWPLIEKLSMRRSGNICARSRASLCCVRFH